MGATFKTIFLTTSSIVMLSPSLDLTPADSPDPQVSAWIARSVRAPACSSLLLMRPPSGEIRFQPSQLGESRTMLVLTSPDGGDYKARA